MFNWSRKIVIQSGKCQGIFKDDLCGNPDACKIYTDEVQHIFDTLENSMSTLLFSSTGTTITLAERASQYTFMFLDAKQ